MCKKKAGKKTQYSTSQAEDDQCSSKRPMMDSEQLAAVNFLEVYKSASEHMKSQSSFMLRADEYCKGFTTLEECDPFVCKTAASISVLANLTKPSTQTGGFSLDLRDLGLETPGSDTQDDDDYEVEREGLLVGGKGEPKGQEGGETDQEGGGIVRRRIEQVAEIAMGKIALVRHQTKMELFEDLKKSSSIYWRSHVPPPLYDKSPLPSGHTPVSHG
ncbi:hypothetical protein BDK51DRAFT_34693 [Blyttiomyces helicus]|uniref:Uncharacterized protein n=1 Tax=Blyttiomyces helicus TaxID=388810 RepID=A0A4P9WP13_9FUNG|nr:hypothetical protein BDK51DRAFT_34693 [Blyttiomyces helicus]|eukprot:RKO93458.1 hypothetical protein BDK51DRAFT_34693 [Blyttiomyces helicus]